MRIEFRETGDGNCPMFKGAMSVKCYKWFEPMSISSPLSVIVRIGYICCGAILSLVQILFFFLFKTHYRTLSYITIPPKQRKIKFAPRKNMHHNIYI